MRNSLPPLLLTTCLTALPAAAYDWSFFAVIPPSTCVSQCEAENAARAAQVERMRSAYAKVEPEMDAIVNWMDGLGFPRPFFPANGPDGTSLISLIDLSQSGSSALRGEWENVYGDYTADRGMALNAQEIPAYTNPDAAEARLDVEVRDTLAHETYHAVQQETGSIDGDDWVVEGTAEFVGNAYASRSVQREYSYAVPLEEPRGAYNRAHFFHMLGRDFGSTSARASYMPRFEEAYDADGVVWVDTFLRAEGKPLAEYFPGFIAQYAVSTADFFHPDGTMGVIDDEASPEVAADTAGERDSSRRFNIEANAAAYMDVTPVFEGDFASLEDSARIYINRISVEEGSDPAALSLVLRSDVVGSQPFLEPMFAASGEMEEPYNVRVVNISERPTASRLNSAIVAMSTTRVTFGLPSCISSDDRIGIIESASLPRDEIIDAFNVDGASLRVRGGGSLSDDLYFSAAGASGRVEIVATLPTLDGGSTTVTVADTVVRPEGCMIQMRIGDARITWDGNGQYTEFAQAGGSEALYMRDDDFAAFFDGGFQPLPAMARDMMMNAFRGRFAGGSLDGIISGLDSMPDGLRGIDTLPTTPSIDVDGAALARLVDDMPAILTDGTSQGVDGEWGMHLMPQTFVERFSWRSLRRLPDRTRRVRAACPAFADEGDAPCSSINLSRDGVQGAVVYSASGWPLTVTMDGQTMEFEADHFPIRRPPGW